MVNRCTHGPAANPSLGRQQRPSPMAAATRGRRNRSGQQRRCTYLFQKHGAHPTTPPRPQPRRRHRQPCASSPSSQNENARHKQVKTIASLLRIATAPTLLDAMEGHRRCGAERGLIPSHMVCGCKERLLSVILVLHSLLNSVFFFF